jgi:hypothetical protein
VSTGIGLTGGDITSTGTIKAMLKDETKNSANSSKSTSTNGGLYAVEADKSGYLAVRVPWINTWKQNTATSEGYVTAPGSNVSGKVWMTENDGTPSW